MPYKPHLVTFFDILGFRNLVENREAAFIEGVLKKLKKQSLPAKELRKLYEIGVVSFSDSVARAVHIASKANIKHPTGILYYELFDLAYLQSLLIHEDGVFLRGAITAENLHIRGATVFGPGLVRAYELESKEAVYPRILVDEALIGAFKKAKQFLGARHHDLKADMKYINALAVRDTDGKRFVNYLGAAHNEIDGDEQFLSVLDKHFERVAEAVGNAGGDSRVLEKYRWVAAYHNRVVGDYPEEFFTEYDTSKSAFLLTDEQVPGLSGWKIPVK